MSERENALKEWLKQVIGHSDFNLTALTGDASFRRYYRVQYNEKQQIVMDAPPEKENTLPFIHVTHILADAQINAPIIIAQDPIQGFLLLSDLGDLLLLKKLTTVNVDTYYHSAINLLLRMQAQCSLSGAELPPFNQAFMMKEMRLCTEWFLTAYLKLDLSSEESALLEASMQRIAVEIAQQPNVFIHRDFHSRNIMLLDDEDPEALAIIDYQDAMIGPLTYDLVSLLKDCYIAWPREQQLSWIEYFHKQSPAATKYTKEQFVRAVDLAGLQRHLKVLGVFSRLYLRDGKAGYLADLPLTLNYVLDCTERYPDLHPLFNMIVHRVSL